MAHIIINPSLSAAIVYNLFFNPPKFAEVGVILEPANSTRTDYSIKMICRRPILKVRGLSIKPRFSTMCIDLSMHVRTCSKRLVSNKPV